MAGDTRRQPTLTRIRFRCRLEPVIPATLWPDPGGRNRGQMAARGGLRVLLSATESQCSACSGLVRRSPRQDVCLW